MKKLMKIVVGLVVVLLVVIIALQIFLNHGLNPAVQKALPEISKSAGVDISLQNISINLLGGSLNVDKPAIANPAGFKEPSVFAVDEVKLDVDLLALLKKLVRVEDVDVKNAKLTVERNADGKVNLQVLQAQLKPTGTATGAPPANVEQPAPGSATAQQPSSEAVNMPKFQLDKLAFTTIFEYVDYKTKDASPLRLGLNLKIDARNIVTFGEASEPEWGKISITGGLREKPDSFKVNLQARVAPLTDPATPSFKLQGQIAAMNLAELGDITNEIGIAGSSVDLTLDLNVNDGKFSEESKFVATVRDARLTGKLKHKYKHVKLPPSLSITIPVSGTLAQPKIYILQAVTKTILHNLKENPNYLLENVSVHGKPLGKEIDHKIDKGLKKLFH